MTRVEFFDRVAAHRPELVRRLGVFGSFARDEAGPESDVDIVIEFEDVADYRATSPRSRAGRNMIAWRRYVKTSADDKGRAVAPSRTG